MTRYVPLQRSVHNKAGYTPSINMKYAAMMTTVPLLREELSHVIQHMSIAFQKRSNAHDNTESFELVGLQSLKPNENLFVLPDGRWLGGYKPAFYRAYPFSLEADKDSTQLQLCVEESAVKFELAQDDLAFFKDETNLSDHMMNFVKFLEKALNGRKSTLSLMSALQQANLITPWSITYSEEEEDGATVEKALNGLYHIDIKALANLTPEMAAKLNKTGALEIAYAQVFSEPRCKGLSTLQKVHKDLQQHQNSIEKEPDLDEIFGEKDEFFSF
ncbi:SapC family protein [Marinomonas sp. 15G1-11]|uniref:SapC family protein n=1 Tax=Marinomonas phaeophyticola TaxID=3004091 RepID=A0ABT4JRV3_9GAMM|nr:SapC family protein [Marinomonas sp. 15G1-11]MCZ2720975.1 SapC family protein [Marinomonas sp. 15G1-11]